MKKLLLPLLLICITNLNYGQTPKTIKYQAVIRDASGNIKSDSPVSVGIMILQGSENGPNKCTETYNLQTNSFGLVSLDIGSMNPSAFSKIDWSKGPYFISVDIDGTNLGCSQIMSVPYAFHANTADSLITQHYVGELYGGGVVFYVDHTGNHGLICSKVEMGYMPWSNVASTNIGIDNQLGQGLFNGKVNSEAIVSQQGHTTSAAKACLDYVNENYGTGIYDDWYLPSQGEFLLLWNNSMFVQKALYKDANPYTRFNENYYWTSTESDQNQGRLFYFCYGYFGWDLKTKNYSVRPIRAF